MLVHTLLCQSAAVSGAITAAADLLGGIGAEFAEGPECAKPHSTMPFIKLHGLDDPNIPYTQPAKEVLFDGVRMLGAKDTAAVRARDNGCGPGDAGPQAPEAGGKMLCTDLCAKKKGAPPVKVCGMVGVKHDTDHPYPGFVYEQAWAFFDKQGKAGAAAAKTRSPAEPAAPAAPPKAPAVPEESARGPSALLVTGSGSSSGVLATPEEIKAGNGRSAAPARAPALGATLLSALAALALLL
jgi:poly(3-hydroxybutyrate) depolymerase